MLCYLVALHDWRTYWDMRSIAEEKLGLHLMDSYLPMGAQDEGLDVLQIMRGIHIFVSRFVSYRKLSMHCS
jgi:WASH complex subunit 7